MDPDSTLALLNGDLPSLPEAVAVAVHDESEDEIFFGEKSEKENSKLSKSVGTKLIKYQ